MEKDAKEALQVTKEITVKFIETGRVSPTNFNEIFPSVYATVLETITRPCIPGTPGGLRDHAATGSTSGEENGAGSGRRKG